MRRLIVAVLFGDPFRYSGPLASMLAQGRRSVELSSPLSPYSSPFCISALRRGPCIVFRERATIAALWPAIFAVPLLVSSLVMINAGIPDLVVPLLVAGCLFGFRSTSLLCAYRECRFCDTECVYVRRQLGCFERRVIEISQVTIASCPVRLTFPIAGGRGRWRGTVALMLLESTDVITLGTFKTLDEAQNMLYHFPVRLVVRSQDTTIESPASQVL